MWDLKESELVGSKGLTDNAELDIGALCRARAESGHSKRTNSYFEVSF